MAQHITDYTGSELEFFRSYREKRSPHRPKRCDGKKNCWVDVGPPAMNSHGICVACNGAPNLRPEHPRYD